MFKASAVLVLGSAVASPVEHAAVDPVIVARVNGNPAATWTAGLSDRFANVSLADASALLGARRASQDARAKRSYVDVLADVALPDSYDPREKYGNCASIKALYDQGKCGGCWAFAAAEALGDRFCAAGKDVVLSPQDLLDCDNTGHDNGCQGGLCEDAYDYISDNGILSEPCVPWSGDQASCTDGSCSAGGSQTKYSSSWAQYVSSDENAIQQELYQKGSIAAAFEVFHDFFSYTSGVYSHLDGDYAGLHAVNLMGWGSDTGVDYWLVKNSWGQSFGEKGFFRIKRGLKNNGCNFEGSLSAASPSLGIVTV